MGYPTSEKTEIIQLVEQSALSAHKTLEQLEAPRAPFCRWYNRYHTGGPEAGSSSWLWSRPSHYLVSWRCGSSAPKATLCPKPRLIGSSKRMI